MKAEEKRQMLASLERGKQALVDALAGVSPEMAQRAPSPGRWMILEVVEHVAISEDYLFGQIEKAIPAGRPVVNAKREAIIPVIGVDRNRRIECPAEGLPAGRFPTLDAALEHFLASRARTVKFVEACEDDLRARMTTHPIMGPANCHEILLTKNAAALPDLALPQRIVMPVEALVPANFALVRTDAPGIMDVIRISRSIFS